MAFSPRRDAAVLEIQNDDNEIDLQFQDFGDTPTRSGKDGAKEQTIYFSNFPDSAEDEQEQKLLGDGETEPISGPVHSFWTFEYYQQFFNVESKQVGDRIIWSMIPKPGVNYLQSYIRPNPDLYGPFWICITLVFTTAITGNLSNYLQLQDTYKWRYDFHKVTLATSSIFSYAWLVPIAIWGLLLWRGSRATLSLLEIICLYGYSLAIFVPVSLLWMIPLQWLQWCLGIVAAVLSGSVLVRTILPGFSHEAKKVAIAVAVLILVLHAALALGFMLYFFYPTSTNVVETQQINSTINNRTLEGPPFLLNEKVTQKEETIAKNIPNEKENGVDNSGNEVGKQVEKEEKIKNIVSKRHDTNISIKNQIIEKESYPPSNQTQGEMWKIKQLKNDVEHSSSNITVNVDKNIMTKIETEDKSTSKVDEPVDKIAGSERTADIIKNNNSTTANHLQR